MPLTPGASFGPYRVVEPIGKGGMGTVYEAYEETLHRHVALKVLPPEFLHDDSFAARFRREARIIARLEHKDIVPIHAFGIDEGIPWMAMRLMAGGSLATRLGRVGCLTLARTVEALRSVAAALDHAHAKGIVHRDLKPGNVLLDQAGHLYLADFGIAKILESATLSAVIRGTPQYMAPEQAHKLEVDHRADIYSLGVMAYEMLAGAVPFHAETSISILMKHASEPVPLVPLRHVSEGAQRAIVKALAKDPAARWSSALAFVDALDEADEAEGEADTLGIKRGGAEADTVAARGEKAQTRQSTEGPPTANPVQSEKVTARQAPAIAPPPVSVSSRAVTPASQDEKSMRRFPTARWPAMAGAVAVAAVLTVAILLGRGRTAPAPAQTQGPPVVTQPVPTDAPVVPESVPTQPATRPSTIATPRPPIASPSPRAGAAEQPARKPVAARAPASPPATKARRDWPVLYATVGNFEEVEEGRLWLDGEALGYSGRSGDYDWQAPLKEVKEVEENVLTTGSFMDDTWLDRAFHIKLHSRPDSLNFKHWDFEKRRALGVNSILAAFRAARARAAAAPGK